MIALAAICLLIYVLIGSLAFVYVKRRNALYWSDIATPILVVVFWVTITAFGYGYQSLSHVVEVPIALMCALLLFNLRVFVIDRYNQRYRANSYSVLGMSLIIVILLRTFMPYLPE